MNPSLRITRLTFWGFAVSAGILQTWSYRFYIEPDGVNYLDISSAYLRRDWSAAINGYWSPLYSWLLAIVQWLFHPSAYWESTFLHLLNFVFYLFALRCFEFFFRRLLSLLAACCTDTIGDKGLPEWAWWVIGYTAFLLATLRLITLGMDTPDMVLAAFLFLSMGILVDLTQRRSGALRHAVLGVVLAAAYLTKSVMFPVSFILILTVAFARGGVRKPDPRALTTLAAFLMVSCPFIIALSRAKGHLTFGETGKMAYLNEVGPSTNGSARSEKLLHPLRKLSEEPTVYEYDNTLAGTFPRWYDPSYWYDGAAIHFDLLPQLRAITRAIANYFRILSLEKEWIAGWLILAIFAGDWRSMAKRWLNLWFLWFPPLAMLSLYSLVLVDPRYVAVAMAIMWISLFSALPWHQINTSPRLGMAAILAIALTTGVALVREEGPNLAACLRPPQHIQWMVTKQLQRMNLAPGDRVAVLGHTTLADYWARMAGLRIVADVPFESVQAYWMASIERRAQISSSLSALGVKGIVSATRPLIPVGWQPLGDTGYYVQILPAPSSIGGNSSRIGP
jgi:4-amino-4-deoxy-L-arabinose transferase-like glycosyltransferase